jgi:hypothetical protein
MQVISLFHGAESSPFCNSYYLFTFSFLSKQTRHGRNIVSFYFFLFICGRTKCLSRQQCVGSSATADALCSSCSLPKYLERWPAALYEAGRSVLMLRKGSKFPRTELNTVHLYQHYSLFVPDKLQYTTWRGDYCECVRPAQLPVLI